MLRHMLLVLPPTAALSVRPVRRIQLLPLSQPPELQLPGPAWEHLVEPMHLVPLRELELQLLELAVLPLKPVIQSLLLPLRLLIFVPPEQLQRLREPVPGLGLAPDYMAELPLVLVPPTKLIYVIHNMLANNVLAREGQWFLLAHAVYVN